MKQSASQEFPPGWNEKKILSVIEHYDQPTDEEGAAEIEEALEAPGETWMSVPTELVGAVTRLIENHAKKASPVRYRNSTTRATMKKARR